MDVGPPALPFLPFHSWPRIISLSQWPVDVWCQGPTSPGPALRQPVTDVKQHVVIWLKSGGVLQGNVLGDQERNNQME